MAGRLLLRAGTAAAALQLRSNVVVRPLQRAVATGGGSYFLYINYGGNEDL